MLSSRRAGLVGEVAGITLTGRRLGRRAEADGMAAAAVIRAQAAAITARTLVPLPPAPLPDMLYLAIDGTSVPMVAAETEGRQPEVRPADPASLPGNARRLSA